MNELFLPIGLIILASFFLGTFGLGMKHIQPLAWESWWSIYVISGMVIFPSIWALIVVPNLWESIATAPSDAVFKGALFGFLWGIGGITFGISIKLIGVSITYGVVMGLSGSIGAIIPLMQIPDYNVNPALPFILSGVLVMLIGVTLAAYAGWRREKMQPGSLNLINNQNKDKKIFRTGLIIVLMSGVLSSLINVGFASANPVAKNAETLGAITRNASLAAWMVVLSGAFVMNGLYILFLLYKNKTLHTFAVPGAGKAYKWGLMAGIFWFAGLGVYGQGAAIMGSLGPVIGWPMFLGLSLIVSNIWAVREGEWKGAKKPLGIMLMSVLVLIIASGILGYANSLL